MVAQPLPGRPVQAGVINVQSGGDMAKAALDGHLPRVRSKDLDTIEISSEPFGDCGKVGSDCLSRPVGAPGATLTGRHVPAR